MVGTTYALFLLLLFGESTADDEGCRRCDHRGVVSCPEHTDDIVEAETRVLFCAFAAACATCRGAMLVDCEHCDGGPDSGAVEERQRAVAVWLAPNALESHMGRSVLRLDTQHFQLVVDTDEVRAKKPKKLSGHVLAHRVADDVEFVAERIAEHFAVEKNDYFSKMRMWYWKESTDHTKAMGRFLKSAGGGDFKILGRNPVFSVWSDEPLFDEEAEVRSLFAHNAAHMLLSNFEKQLWVGDQGGGWFDAGLGHWYEYLRHARSVNYCIDEATIAESYENGVWRAAIRKRLKKEKEPQLPRLVELHTGQMSQPDQALCWSFYDYLVAEHPASLRPIMEDLKVRRPTREILPERIGMTTLQADESWRAWVQDTYPTRGDEPKRTKGK